MKLGCCLLLLLALVLPEPAEALDWDQAYALARTGDPGTIESAFAAHQASFNAGEIDPHGYRSPFWVFETTEPKVEATVDAWLAAHPESPQAQAARAMQLFYIALLVRGSDYAPKTVAAAMSEFRQLGEEALRLARRALDAEPRHLAVAHRLLNMGAFLGSRADRDRAFLVIEQLDEPASVLLSGLRFNYKRWGGGPEATRRFCEERAPMVPDISVEECLALADYDQRDENPALLEPAIATLSRGSVEYFLPQHLAAMLREGRAKEAHELARSRGYMTYELAYAFANSLDDMSIVEEFTARNLQNDPLNPVALAVRGRSLAQSGDRRAAWEAFEKAMKYGSHHPFVRRTRIEAMASDPELGGDFLDEITDALEATDDAPEILGEVMLYVMYPAKDITHLEDGTPRPGFECTQLRILERHKLACGAGFRHHTCEPGLAAHRDIKIVDGRARELCGEATGTTWQDLIRYLLEWTE